MPQSITGKKTFGAGRFWGINGVTAPTPMRAVLPQDMSIDFKLGTKELRGENRFAAAIAIGDISVSGKVTLGGSSSKMFGDLIFGSGAVIGQILEADKEAGTIPASVSYIVTVVNAAHFTTDLGVFRATDGLVYARVASAPATGQYSVAAGVYTFAAADAGTNVLISYLYTQATSGVTVNMANSIQGPAGAFASIMAFVYGPDQDVLTLNNCLATDAGIATKQGDFTKPTFGFMASTDNADNLGTFAFAQVD